MACNSKQKSKVAGHSYIHGETNEWEEFPLFLCTLHAKFLVSENAINGDLGNKHEIFH